MSPELSDDEVDRICAGYTQSAAKVRYLRSLGLPVARKPNGRPLVTRRAFEECRFAPAHAAIATDEPNWN